jgi:hypothetical protein
VWEVVREEWVVSELFVVQVVLTSHPIPAWQNSCHVLPAATATEIERLRDDVSHWREQACDLEDKLQWHTDALSDTREDARVQMETLQRESEAARNVLSLWKARKAQADERRARERLELQLLEATAKSQAQLSEATTQIEMLKASSVEHFGVAKPFDLRFGVLAGLQEGGSRLREIGDAADSAFLKAMESIVPGDPEGVFNQLMAKPSFRNRL